MIKGNKKKPQVFFDSDDEHDLDLFCRIEEALQNDTPTDKNYFQQQQEQSRLASEFPSCFVQNSKAGKANNQREHFNSENDSDNNFYDGNDNENCQSVEISKEEIIQFHEMYKEFQAKLSFLSEKQKEIDRDASWVKKEKKELERERKRIEADRLIVEANLSNVELIDLRQKYEDLQRKYEKEKSEWEEEKNALIQQIEELKGKDSKTNKSISKNKKNKSKLNESLHVDFKLPNDSSFIQNIDIENSNIKDVANSVQNNTLSSNSSSSSPPPSVKKQETNSSKKSKQLKPKYSVFTNTPLHPNYQLELTFDPGPVIKEEIKSNDGRKLLRYKNNLSATLFPNGTRKMRYKDNIFIFYSNGDTAQEFKDGARGYRYAETGAIELQLPDKTVYYEFPESIQLKTPSKTKQNSYSTLNIKQREIHYPDGNKEILYPNGIKKVLHLNGDYEIYYPTGRTEKCVNGNVVNIYD